MESKGYGVAVIIHQYLSVNSKLIGEKIPYYKYKPPAVLESTQYTLYFDGSIITDKTITNNKPDIVLQNKSSVPDRHYSPKQPQCGKH